jgi:hypothetical protein
VHTCFNSLSPIVLIFLYLTHSLILHHPECLSGFICNKIGGGEVTEEDLKCPQVGCPHFISHATIRGCTSGVGKAEEYNKFLTFATERYLSTIIGNGEALRCPNETCNYVFQWRPDGSSVAFKCEKCSSEYCLNCSLMNNSDDSGSGSGSGDTGGVGIGPGHAPLSCAQQKEKMDNEVAEREKFEEWKQLNAHATELFEDMIKANGWKSK